MAKVNKGRLSEAIARACRALGEDPLGSYGRFSGALLDMAGDARREAGLLLESSDERYLSFFRGALGKGPASARDAARRASAYMQESFSTDKDQADELSAAFADALLELMGARPAEPAGAETESPTPEVPKVPEGPAPEAPEPKKSAPVADKSPEGSAPGAKGPHTSRRAFIIAGVGAAAALVGGGLLVNRLSRPSDSPLDDYSWEELADIADQIAGAGSDDEGIEIAKKYHLCTEDGTLDGTQLKSFELSDGTKAQAQIVDFRHDDRADGSGRAGITFITKDRVAGRAMNPSDDNSGGWEKCELRSWANSELLGTFPEDLSSVIVPVWKMTNNAGVTEDASSVTATEDALWLLSFVELVGADQVAGESAGDVYAAEGSQYRLYSDEDVQYGSSNDVLVKELDGGADWWGRSPDPLDSVSFRLVSDNGNPSCSSSVNSPIGVAPGFCL